MDLKLKDVAELLNVSETTVRRWVKANIIPAYQLNREYKFSREEIEKWMLDRKVSSKQREPIFGFGERQNNQSDEKENRLGQQQFSLYRAIHHGGVFHNIPGKDKETIIRETMKIVAKNMKLDADVLSELLLDREKLMPTTLNHGVAVPHAREFLIGLPVDFVAVVFPQKPIEYGALDGEPVHTLFFLFATGDKTHLHLLAKLAHITSQEKALSFLKTLPDAIALLKYIKDWEANLAVPK